MVGLRQKDQVLDICQMLRTVVVNAPIKLGDILLRNVLGTGADVVATRDVAVAA